MARVTITSPGSATTRRTGRKGGGVSLRERETPCPPGFVRIKGKCVREGVGATDKDRGISDIANLPVGSLDRGFFIEGKKVSQRDFEILKDRNLGRERLERQREATTQKLEQAGAFEDVSIKKQELSFPLETDTPIITPTLGAASQFLPTEGLFGGSVLAIARDLGLFPKLLPKIKTGEEAFPTPETPETLREAALRQVQINAFKEGTSKAEKFGAFMELLPGFGAIDQWVEGVVEAPFGNAEDVLAQILVIGNTATNLQEKTRSGIMRAPVAMNRAREMEEQLSELEGRLKLFVGESKILQANTEQVNEWEEKILDAKRRTNNFRNSAAFALTADISGTGRIVPTDEELFFELKEGRK